MPLTRRKQINGGQVIILPAKLEKTYGSYLSKFTSRFVLSAKAVWLGKLQFVANPSAHHV
jgi:hypothetical protein